MTLLLKNQSPFPIIHLFQAAFTWKCWKSNCTHIFTPVSSATGPMFLCHPLPFLLASKCSWAYLLISAKQAGRGIRNTELPQAMEIEGQAVEEPLASPHQHCSPSPTWQNPTREPAGSQEGGEPQRSRGEDTWRGSSTAVLKRGWQGMPAVLQRSGKGNDWRYHGRERWQSTEATKTHTQITVY